jgi:hypothetical protein
VFQNPGSPIVTSSGSDEAIVWVLDENAPRTALLNGDAAPRPVLYALDALDLKLLWKSPAGELHPSGKYNEPAFARGSVFVGTDRIQAFAAGGRAAHREALTDVAEADAASKARDVAGSDADSATDNLALDTLDAETIYRLRCADCHDHPQGRIPPKELLANRTEDYIISVLTSGIMRENARGLTPEQIRALAHQLRSYRDSTRPSQ